MRIAAILVLIAPLSVYAACSSNTTPAADAGIADSGPDVPFSFDARPPAPDVGSPDTSVPDTGPSFVDGSIPSGGATPDPGSVKCGATTCATPANACCAPAGGAGTSSCAPTSDPNACSGQAAHECDETADCPAGLLCCGSFDQGPFVITRCRSYCIGAGEVPQVCKRNGECVNGNPCAPCHDTFDGLLWGLCEAVLQCQ